MTRCKCNVMTKHKRLANIKLSRTINYCTTLFCIFRKHHNCLLYSENFICAFEAFMSSCAWLTMAFCVPLGSMNA